MVVFGTAASLAQTGPVPGVDYITLDKTHGFVGICHGDAVVAETGHSGKTGDRCIDLGESGSGSSVLVDDASFLSELNAANAHDVITYSVWVKLRSNDANSLFWANTVSGARAVNVHFPWSNTVYFDTGGLNTTQNRISQSITGFAPYQAVGDDTWWNSWHHVVAIKNGSAGTDKWIYVDGVKLLEGANTAALLADVATLNIGSANGDANSVRGWIDDFAVYSSALSEADITALATGTAPDAVGAKASLIAYWPMDNTMLAPSVPVVGAVSSKANGWKFNISDSDISTPNKNSITVAFDGTSVPVQVVQSGNLGGGDGTGVTTVSYESAALFMNAGSKHTLTIHFTGTPSFTVDKEVSFTVANYTVLSESMKAPGTVDTSVTDGFYGRIHQLPMARYPDSGSLNGIETQLADGYINATNGLPFTSLDATSTFSFRWVNWALEAPSAGTAGYFSSEKEPDYVADDPVPGLSGAEDANNDNVAAELLSVLYLPVGSYQLGATHDDGLKISVGSEPRDIFAAKSLASNAGTTEIGPINIVVTNAGYYPVRLLWGQGVGNAHLEFFNYDWATGQRQLINDRTKTSGITAYASAAALTHPYVLWVSPMPEEIGQLPTVTLTAKLQDGSAATIAEARLSCNGASITGSKTGAVTMVKLSPGRLSSGAHTVTLVYTTSLGVTTTNFWNFTVGAMLDKTHDYVGICQGTAAQTANAGGHTGKSGDYAIDLGNGGSGTSVLITDAAFLAALNQAHANDVVTYSIWTKLRNNNANSLLWANTTTGARALNLHFPWGNTVYFDTGGYDNTMNRISESITAFPGYQAVGNDTWWNQWHHVVVIKKGTTDTDKWVYIDGVKLVDGYNTEPMLSDVNALYLGAASGNANSVNGWIDDFAVYSSALSEAEITALAAGTAPDAISAQSSLIAYWSFDEAATMPTLQIARDNGAIALTYSGTLQSSATVNGTYSDVAGANSPYAVNPTESQRYFRVRQ